MLAVATTIVKALTVGEFAHLLFELIHRTHLGHKTAHGIHKAGNFVVYHIKQQHQQRQDKQNPGQKEERETETPYNFKDTVNTEQSIEKLKDKAESYLTKLNEGVKNLQKAQEHYAEANKTLEELTVALSSNNNAQFSIHLINFNKNLIGFKNELKVSSRSIAPPPRQILYIADPSNGKNEHGSIQRYNECLESINKCFEEMEKTRQKIFEQFEKGVSAIRKLRSRSSPGVEQLQQDIQRSMRSPVQLSEKMHALLPNNTKLAAACTDIIQVFAEFQQGYKIKQGESFENDPIWTPLLTSDKQIKAGQRIFLHAMNESELKTDPKLKIAQIFLRKFISKQEAKQANIDEQAYEMARLLRMWQIKKCDEFIQFLSTLKQEEQLPKLSTPGINRDKMLERLKLVKWLKKDKVKQNVSELFKEILVLPCCFSQCDMKSVFEKLKKLSIVELDPIIKRHLGSHWGANWGKNDTLIQLPKSFKTDVWWIDRRKQDDHNVVSSVMQRLAKTLIVDFGRLEKVFEKDAENYKRDQTKSKEKGETASNTEKDQEHEAGVARIKKAGIDTKLIDSPSSFLSPYLYQTKTIYKEWQVPTIDDLLQIIYLGIDPNMVCNWQVIPNQQNAIFYPLTYYFSPKGKEDTRTKAWLYAYTECQTDSQALLAHLFSVPLALTNMRELEVPPAIKNELLIQAFFNGSMKIPSIANSKALNGITTKEEKEIKDLFQQLEDCHRAALLSVYPELRKQLPPLKQWGYFFNNLFKKSQKIGENELKITQGIMGDLSVVLSIEDEDRGDALDRLEKKYKEKYKEVECANNSALSTTLKKILEVSIPSMRKRLDGLKKITSDSKPVEQQTDKKKENQRKEKETTQTREKAERKEKEVAQAENERLKALLVKLQPEEPQAQAQPVVAGENIQEREPKANSIHENPKPVKAKARINGQSQAGSQETLFKAKRKLQARRKPVVARSWGTLYSIPQASNTAAENASLPGCSHAS